MESRTSLGWPTMRPQGDAPPERAWSPESFQVLAKPTGAICNLGCSYCFFLDKELLYEGSRFHMSDETLETFIDQLIKGHASPHVAMSWQGGEPTLMGIDFFRRAIELQEKHRNPGTQFANTIQTNGTLLNDEWCEFFKENDYLVGISIDGPPHLHDVHRVSKKGKGTFDKVLRGLQLLQKHGVEYNILTTVNSVNADYPLEVYRFLRDDLGASWMQFIPVVERVDAEGNPAFLDGEFASDRSVRPEQLGTFMSMIFDEWVRNDVGSVFVRMFEAAIRNWMGYESSGMCFFNETCGTGFALEHNGDLYSCDHFVEPEYLLGNVNDTAMEDMVGSRQQYDFGMAKRDQLPEVCRSCDVRFACHGECPKNRFVHAPDGEDGLNFLCEGYKAFFRHIDEPTRIMATLIAQQRPTDGVMQIMRQRDLALEREIATNGRNGPCPCGSGKKTKRCHGAKTPRAIRHSVPMEPGPPRPRVGRRASG